MKIAFEVFKKEHLLLWYQWVQIPHVKTVWFIEGYQSSDAILEKITGNGYDHPYVIYLDEKPIGYIACCDLYAYRTLCRDPKGLFSQEKPGTFCMDIFIAEADLLNKGLGTQIVKKFAHFVFVHFKANKILIDPAITNKRAIRCYEKVGFKFIKEAFDGITQCAVLSIEKFSIPKALNDNINAIYQQRGKTWLKGLPNLLQHFENEWQLTIEPCYHNLSFNYVAPATLHNGDHAVIKCGPVSPEFQTEVAALQYFNGIGAVKLLQSNSDAGVMLLEHLDPGITLETKRNTLEGAEIAIAVMNQLHKTINTTTAFPTLAQWFTGFDRLYKKFEGNTGPFPKNLIDQAYQISQELLNSMGEQVLLHGDLHYDNILLSQQRGWLAIDPKGVIGEREYEIPLPKLNNDFSKQQLEINLYQFIEITRFDSKRVKRWLFSKAVLAAWWSYEDSGKIDQRFIECAEIIATI